MFLYFGYGSNLSRASLRVKGVEVHATEPAVLQDWRVSFNIEHPFPVVEGSVANVVPAAGGVVHGVLCTCEDRYLPSLDLFEGLGVFYERRQLEVRTYDGDTKLAHVYVGTPERVGAEGKPSQRYRNILLDGGHAEGLAGEYLDWLANVPTHAPPQYPRFAAPQPPPERLSVEQLGRRPSHTALAGYLFDMSTARPAHAILRSLLGGTDATLFILQRMDSSSGVETLEDIAAGRLSDAQQRHLNDYLHEFSREYRYAGHLR